VSPKQNKLPWTFTQVLIGSEQLQN